MYGKGANVGAEGSQWEPRDYNAIYIKPKIIIEESSSITYVKNTG